MDIFDPVKLSIEENKFVLAHVGEPPLLALRDIPSGVIPAAVRPIIQRAYELQELQEHTGERWVGVKEVKRRIELFLENMEKWRKDFLTGRSKVRFPSMHTYDTKGRAHRGGPGADAGQVRTYVDDKGERQPFAIHLTQDVIVDPDEEVNIIPESAVLAPGLFVVPEKNRVECFCGHTESFKPDSHMSLTAAKTRMAKHLLRATTDIDKHREIHTHVFGG